MWQCCNGSLKLATAGSIHTLPNYTNECQIRKNYAPFNETILTQTRDVVKTTPVLHSGRSLSLSFINYRQVTTFLTIVRC
jgi:hypothetical protein